jgi:prepilin-type N-terminal cleavage/methylation domain-containing protein/prepilin-type processing-associated H-X9-DG protein
VPRLRVGTLAQGLLASQDLIMCKNRRGFTLVELLVVIAIIGILVALLLPAIQAAREAARRSQCTNNLKNLTLGMVNHESNHGRWPSSGWDGSWTGDPDRGAGERQPGGWFYSILPFIEQQAIYDKGQGTTLAARAAELAARDAMTVAIANCPSRRTGGPYIPTAFGMLAPISGDGTGKAFGYQVTLSARSDYAVNVGDEFRFDNKCLNLSPNEYGLDVPGFPPQISEFTGVSFCGTAVESRNISDGLSNTIALGEKWVPAANYTDGLFEADDWGMYTGFQDDMVRSTYYNGSAATHTPRNDAEILTLSSDIKRELFGSPHPGGCQVSMCDGSVRLLEYEIDAEAFREMGHRADEGAVKKSDRPF